MPLLPAWRLVQTSSVPMPHPHTSPTPVTTTRRLKGKLSCSERGRLTNYFAALACFSMYSMASFTVAIFSASSSGISMPKASSKAMTSSTVSSESAPRSSTNEAVGVTSPSSTPSCSTIICLTRSSTLASLIAPPIFRLARAPGKVPQAGASAQKQPAHSMRGVRPGQPYAPISNGATSFLDDAPKLSHVHPAVDVEHLPGDVAGLVAGEKHDSCRDFAVFAEPRKRYQRFHFVFQIVRKRIGHRRGDESRRDAVHRDAPRSDFHGNRARQPHQPGLRRDIICLSCISGFRDDRRNIDDASRARPEHGAQRLLRAKKRSG